MVHQRILSLILAVTLTTVVSGQIVKEYSLILTTWNLHTFNRSGVVTHERRNVSYAFSRWRYELFYDCLRTMFSSKCVAESSSEPSKGNDFYEAYAITADRRTEKRFSGYNYNCSSPNLPELVCYRIDAPFDACARGLRCRRLFQFYDIDSTVVSLFWTDDNPIYIGGGANSLGEFNACKRTCGKGHETSSDLAMILLGLFLPAFKQYLT